MISEEFWFLSVSVESIGFSVFSVFIESSVFSDKSVLEKTFGISVILSLVRISELNEFVESFILSVNLV